MTRPNSTLRRWITQVEPYTTDKKMGIIAHGILMGLRSALYRDWPSPVAFLQVGNRKPPAAQKGRQR